MGDAGSEYAAFSRALQARNIALALDMARVATKRCSVSIPSGGAGSASTSARSCRRRRKGSRPCCGGTVAERRCHRYRSVWPDHYVRLVAVRRQGRPTERESLGIAKTPFIEELIAACVTARAAAERPVRERDRQVEDAFFRAAAALQTFLSEWLVRTLSFDAAYFRSVHEQRAANWATSQLSSAAYPPKERLWTTARPAVVEVHLPIPRKLTLEEAARLLGAEADHVAIRNTAELVTRAKECLPDKYARRARELGRTNSAILDATIAVRNVLAHRSPRAAAAMNAQFELAAMPKALRRTGQRKVRTGGVGQYLVTHGGAAPRFETYLTGLADVAHCLAPTPGRNPTICPSLPAAVAPKPARPAAARALRPEPEVQTAFELDDRRVGLSAQATRRRGSGVR